MRQSEFWLLVTLKKAHEGDEHGVRVSQLARRLDIATPTATQMVIRLEDAGYVERRRSAKDGRVVHVALTEAGTRFLESVHREFVNRFDAAVEFLGEKNSDVLAGLLNRLIDFLSNHAQDESSTMEEDA